MPYADWADVLRDLTRTVDGLADGEFLILGEPPSEPGWRRILRPWAGPAPVRYVQALRIEEVLAAECVGPIALGGIWDMDEPTIERLRRMGWLVHAETGVPTGNPTGNFEQYAERSEGPLLADLMVASLALLGAEPGALKLRCSGGAALAG